ESVKEDAAVGQHDEERHPRPPARRPRCSGSSWLPRRKRHHYIQHCRLRSRPHPPASSSFPARSRSADAHAAKVSTQPQTPNTAKMHRSTLVINKFVGSTPLTVADQLLCNSDAAAAAVETTTDAPAPALRRVPSSTSTTTLAAPVAVASTSTDGDDDDECGEPHHPAGAAAPAANTKQLLLFAVAKDLIWD
ncbi:Os01g0302250, partial [Oryza sativa Japonica Group]